MNIFNLFPTPVAQFKLDRELNSTELNFIDENETKMYKNEGNFTSINTEVLEDTALNDLKKFILEKVNEYFDNIICPANEVTPYISLSWLNYTFKDGWHHKHTHGNSIVSGVFYIKTTSDDKIHFYNDKHKHIEFHTEKFNPYNSTSWWLPAEQNSLLLFPSDLPHSVTTINSDDERISLSFNVFVKGEIGSKSNLKWLNLK